jgi:putative addiction module component (TIGR02574 family)
MKPVPISEVLELPVQERIRLAQEIWDSVAEVPESVHLTDAERVELDKRLDAYYEDRNRGSPWPEVRARILKAR